MVDWTFECHPARADVCANIKPGWSEPTEAEPREPERGMTHACEYMPGQAIIKGPPEMAGQFGFVPVDPIDILPGEAVFDDELEEAAAALGFLSEHDRGIYKLSSEDASLFEAIDQVQAEGQDASPHYMLRPAPFWRGGPYSTVKRLGSKWGWGDLTVTGPSNAEPGGTVIVIDTGGHDLIELEGFGIECTDKELEPAPEPQTQFDRRYVGHGTFAATIAKKYNPHLNVTLLRGWSKNGILSEATLLMAFMRADPAESVVSLSLGTYPCGPNYDPLGVEVALTLARGGRVVAAAGNDGRDHIPRRLYPASLSRVVGVGAYDTSWAEASWSNRGEAWAPGEDVVSWYHDGTNGSLAAWSGSSFATPHYAARVASGI